MILVTEPCLELTFPGLGGSGEACIDLEKFFDLRPNPSPSPSLVSEFDFFNPLNTLSISIVGPSKLQQSHSTEASQNSTAPLSALELGSVGWH